MKKSFSIIKLYFGIGFFITLAVFIWLILTPSISNEFFFLNYSLQRFGLIAITCFFLILFSLGLAFANSRIVYSIFSHLTSSKILCFLLFVTVIIVAFLFLGRILNLYGSRTLLFTRILPILIFLFFIALETLIFQHIISHNLIQSTIDSILKNLTTSFETKYWKVLIIGFTLFLFVKLLLIATSLFDSPTIDIWRIGDWLINYQGGFVRRGLIGEISLQISRLPGINIIAIIIIIQMLFYLIFSINFLRLAINIPCSPLTAMLLFSPAFMLFTAINPLGTFRKEILFFAFLSIVSIYLVSSKKRISTGWLIGIGLTSGLIVMSHEMLVAFLPYLICAVIVREKGFTDNSKKVIISLLPAVLIAAWLYIFGKGNAQIVVEICNSLKTIAPPDCTTQGAIFSLGQDLQSAHSMVLQRIGSDTIISYAISALLGFLPIGLFVVSMPREKILRNKKLVFWLAFFVCSSIICSLPLFWVAVDYGRFIYIHITCLSLLVLMVNQKNKETTQKIAFKSLFPFVISILFIVCWRLIYAGATFNSAFPLFDAIRDFI